MPSGLSSSEFVESSEAAAPSQVKDKCAVQLAQSTKPERPDSLCILSEAKSAIKNKGGRPSSLQRLGISKVDIWNLAAQGLSNAQIAKRFCRSKGKVSVRTIATYRAEMPNDFKREFEDFDMLPGVEEFYTWLQTRRTRRCDVAHVYSQVREIWNNCWKKPLELLDEKDIVKAVAWIKEAHKGNEFGFIIAIRTLIHWGIGQPSWLSKHLGTKGKKRPPRSLAILSTPEFFEEILPRIDSEVDNLQEIQQHEKKQVMTTRLTQRMRDELHLVFAIKPTTGIRTGAMKERGELLERELWGTRLAAGKTNLQIVDGKFVDWVVFAKRNEIWHIRYMPPKVETLLLNHVRKYRIKEGEPLLQELTRPVASASLRSICRRLGITDLRLHDFRKVYLTALCLSGVPLETAVELNVGWLDLNTARKYYLQIKALNANQEYSKMAKRFFR
jgi:integrase/DNA-binding CsgD family transcriptional regulator